MTENTASVSALEQLQGFMQAALLQQGPLLDADQVARHIASSARLSPMQSLAIYQRGYFSRLLQCMQSQFKALHHALGPELFDRLNRTGAIEVLEPWTNPDTQRPAAISRERLRQIERDTLPVAVTGDAVQYQVNRSQAGWVIELINNDGVVKEGRQPAVVHPQVIARVKLAPRFAWIRATEWETGSALPTGAAVELEIPPGESRFVEFTPGP